MRSNRGCPSRASFPSARGDLFGYHCSLLSFSVSVHGEGGVRNGQGNVPRTVAQNLTNRGVWLETKRFRVDWFQVVVKSSLSLGYFWVLGICDFVKRRESHGGSEVRTSVRA